MSALLLMVFAGFFFPLGIGLSAEAERTGALVVAIAGATVVAVAWLLIGRALRVALPLVAIFALGAAGVAAWLIWRDEDAFALHGPAFYLQAGLMMVVPPAAAAFTALRRWLRPGRARYTDAIAFFALNAGLMIGMVLAVLVAATGVAYATRPPAEPGGPIDIGLLGLVLALAFGSIPLVFATTLWLFVLWAVLSISGGSRRLALAANAIAGTIVAVPFVASALPLALLVVAGALAVGSLMRLPVAPESPGRL
jgi:hypothetical protein